MTRLLIPLMIPVVLGYGYLEGRWTQRWQPSRQLDEAVAGLAALPLHVGDWEGEERQLDPKHIAKAEIRGYRLRTYIQRTTGKSVSMLLVCGRAGPTSLHTPEVCYPGSGFRQQGSSRREKTAAAEGRPTEGRPAAEFWVGRFHKPDAPEPESLRIYWAWSANGAGTGASGTGATWTAPDRPRLAFASAPALYKLYVIEPLHPLEEKQENVAAGFLRELLPQLQRYLFHPPKRPAHLSGQP